MIAKITNENTIEVYDLSQFDINSIMNSGQVFRWDFTHCDNCYTLDSGDKEANLYYEKSKAIISTKHTEYFFNYFDLNNDYNLIKSELTKYNTINKILNDEPSVGGIRILKGDFIETVISFIISANNNIKRFSNTIFLLCNKFGTNNAFPTLQQLQTITQDEFKKIGCGYRDSYLVNTVKMLSGSDFIFEVLNQLDNKDLEKKLMTLSGVGKKVANCIMLFCFNRLYIAPVDTWIKKAIDKMPDADKQVLLNHKYAGVAQQYIFYYLQHLKRELSEN